MNENKPVEEREEEIRETIESVRKKINDMDSEYLGAGILLVVDFMVSCAVAKSNLKPLWKVLIMIGLYDEMQDNLRIRREKKETETNSNTIGFSGKENVNCFDGHFTDKVVLGFRA